MINVFLNGKVLSSGSYKSKKDNKDIFYTDVYEPDSGSSVRVYGYDGSKLGQLTDVCWRVSVYSKENGLYVKFLGEVK